jgi:acetolactate synthase-1/2/3 large subunit
MNGAEAIIRTATDAGIDICFANPGTTELPFVAALDAAPGMRAVLGLFEGVCTGAADGYGRMAGKPALTLLHLGPGLANGVANLHNARRAGTPIVNLIGEHASWHVANDPPLAMDIAGLSATFSGWVRTVGAAGSAAQDMADAIAAARQGQIATLIIPNDYQWEDAGERIVAVPQAIPAPVDAAAIDGAAQVLRSGRRCALLLGSPALERVGLDLAARIAAATGCDVLADGFAGKTECGAGILNPPRIQYYPEHALPQLAPYESVVLVAARPPVAFFGYPNTPGRFLRPEQQVMSLGAGGQNPAAVLAALATAVNAPLTAHIPSVPRPMPATGPLTPASIGATLAALQPENAIVVNEGVTSSRGYVAASAAAPPFTLLTISGGAIGFGIPAATGAALACPDRPVFDFQADGSGMYTLQGLWTQAREGLNVTTLIASNQRYHILDQEFGRAGLTDMGPRAQSLIDLGRPALDWVQLAQGMGVPAVAAHSAEELAAALLRALAEPGPHLVEMMM